MDCFDGKLLINCLVVDGICKIEELINLVFLGDVEVYCAVNGVKVLIVSNEK